jgi:hypothetical protein
VIGRRLVWLVGELCASLSAALSVADTVTAEPATDSPPAAESATEFPNAGVIITPQWLQFPLGVPRVVISRDTRIGDPTVSYKDPEFLVAERLVTWQDGENQIWVCRFDPLTGAFLPADGRGWLVAQGAAPLLHFEERLAGTVINGPEFGLTRRDLAVYFCHGSDPANYQVAKVSLRSRELEILAPGLTNGTRGLFAAQDRSDRYGRVMHRSGSRRTTRPSCIRCRAPRSARTARGGFPANGRSSRT